MMDISKGLSEGRRFRIKYGGSNCCWRLGAVIGMNIGGWDYGCCDSGGGGGGGDGGGGGGGCVGGGGRGGGG